MGAAAGWVHTPPELEGGPKKVLAVSWRLASTTGRKMSTTHKDIRAFEKEQNLKALFRRAKARIGRCEFKTARADVKAAKRSPGTAPPARAPVRHGRRSS